MIGKVTIALLTCIAGAAAAQSTPRLNANGDFTQQLSGMIYPDHVGNFTRMDIQQHRPDGSDVTVAYLRGQSGAELVVTAWSFSFPPVTTKDGKPVTEDIGCEPVASKIVNMVVQSTPTLKRLSADKVAIEQGGPQQGYHAAYGGTVPIFMKRNNQAVKSDVYVFCPPVGSWIMAYRATYPASLPDARDEIAAFLAGLTWTFRSSS